MFFFLLAQCTDLTRLELLQKFYFRGINKHFCLVEFELDEKMIPNCFFLLLKV